LRGRSIAGEEEGEKRRLSHGFKKMALKSRYEYRKKVGWGERVRRKRGRGRGERKVVSYLRGKRKMSGCPRTGSKRKGEGGGSATISYPSRRGKSSEERGKKEVFSARTENKLLRDRKERKTGMKGEKSLSTKRKIYIFLPV